VQGLVDPLAFGDVVHDGNPLGLAFELRLAERKLDLKILAVLAPADRQLDRADRLADAAVDQRPVLFGYRPLLELLLEHKKQRYPAYDQLRNP